MLPASSSAAGRANGPNTSPSPPTTLIAPSILTSDSGSLGSCGTRSAIGLAIGEAGAAFGCGLRIWSIPPATKLAASAARAARRARLMSQGLRSDCCCRERPTRPHSHLNVAAAAPSATMAHPASVSSDCTGSPAPSRRTPRSPSDSAAVGRNCSTLARPAGNLDAGTAPRRRTAAGTRPGWPRPASPPPAACRPAAARARRTPRSATTSSRAAQHRPARRSAASPAPAPARRSAATCSTSTHSTAPVLPSSSAERGSAVRRAA